MKKFLLAVYVLVSVNSTCHAHFFSTPNSPLLAHYAPKLLKTGSTTVSAHRQTMKATKAFDATEHTTPLFEHYGTMNIGSFSKGLEPAAGTALKAVENKNATLHFGDLTNTDRTQSSQTQEAWLLSFKQDLFSGLFCMLDICKETTSLALHPFAQGADKDSVEVQNFLRTQNFFNGHGNDDLLQPTPQSIQSAETHSAAHIGWAGGFTQTSSSVQEASGSLSAGYLFQPDFAHHACPLLLPQNISDGFIFQLDGSIRLFSHVRIEAHADATVYNRRSGTAYVVRDASTNSIETAANIAKRYSWYQGPLLLGKGTVKKDSGNLYNFSSTVTLDRFYGFACGVMYTFTYQDTTRLTLEDTTVMSDLKLQPLRKEKRLNSNPKLLEWKHHALTFFCECGPTTTAYRWIPRLRIHTSYPFLGKRCFKAEDAWGISSSLSAQWTF